MKNLIIICDNLKDEVTLLSEKIVPNNNIKYTSQIIYVDSKYHNMPEKLNLKLQEIIDENKEYETITLLYGQCGNATLGLKSDYSKLILPKVSDCVSLYLGGDEKRKKLKKSERTYFFTKKYMENDNSLYNEIIKMKEKYGDKKTIKMYRMMMDNYEYIRIINTKAYDVEDIMEKVKYLCNDLDLSYEIIDGDLSIMENVLLGIVDANFIVKDIGEEINNKDF
ncbi:DUF1638 domain-containing protein [Terrisporobacter glycolicus]|uniref:DUF1638 domain-containing protein n=1 Tax=Terrisporobacter glycolicus ATCC 14880 = DSM 1288 TaxID=1121315 RepID=A0ABZ2ERN8_9FIRM|nr:DUF1638 domain-containing protein [Terrisporobacter glycolicus]